MLASTLAEAKASNAIIRKACRCATCANFTSPEAAERSSRELSKTCDGRERFHGRLSVTAALNSSPGFATLADEKSNHNE
jgi:hypothetical protein